MERGVEQAIRVLPGWARALVRTVPELEQAEELRMRVDRPPSVVLPGGEAFLGERTGTPEDLELLLEQASRCSVHAVLEQLREGFVTIEGGHRVGFCGTAVMEGGQITFLRELTSANVRIARQVVGIGEKVAGALFEGGMLQNALIVAPPGGGKTSLLRDVIRTISDGTGVPPLRVGVVDSRGELGAAVRGVPQLDLGTRADLLTGCPRDLGLLMLLRAMNPQVLAVDEVASPQDVAALETAAGCGAALLATVHGRGKEDLLRRPVLRNLMDSGLFTRIVTIQGRGCQRSYLAETLSWEGSA